MESLSFQRKTMKFITEILYPEIEPGIINNAMVDEAYLKDCKGEQSRLHAMDPIVYENITQLRLESKNILVIDHLWIIPNLTKLSLCFNKIEVIENMEMLTALKELDLSFNYIEKIDNLEKLVNLEVLTLFNNLITEIENLDALEKLFILSLGNNRIKSTKGIGRFRFMKDLRVLNLEGNPIAEDPKFDLRLYIAAVLPQIKYYKSMKISEEMRHRGEKMFVRELREIVSNEEKEKEARAEKSKEKLDAERLSLSFVENLNEHQLYQSLWEFDEDGRILMMVGPAAEDLDEEYDNNIYDIAQEISKIGLECYEEREQEINELKSCLEEGINRIQNIGSKTIENFYEYKDELFEKITILLKERETRLLRGEEQDSPEIIQLMRIYDDLAQLFDEAINDVWQQLMTQELHLHENIEETIVNFQRNIDEMVSKFVEQAQVFFGQLRDIAMHFSENLSEVVSNYISKKMALQDFTNVPSELRQCLEDPEAVINLVAGMKDTHVQLIDEREDLLIARSRDFIEKMIEALNNSELDRNRQKILEINAFLDLMIEALNNLSDEVHEQILNEEREKNNDDYDD